MSAATFYGKLCRIADPTLVPNPRKLRAIFRTRPSWFLESLPPTIHSDLDFGALSARLRRLLRHVRLQSVYEGAALRSSKGLALDTIPTLRGRGPVRKQGPPRGPCFGVGFCCGACKRSCQTCTRTSHTYVGLYMHLGRGLLPLCKAAFGLIFYFLAPRFNTACYMQTGKHAFWLPNIHSGGAYRRTRLAHLTETVFPWLAINMY